MENSKVTGIIIALIVGGVGGYLISGSRQTLPSKNDAGSQSVMTQTQPEAQIMSQSNPHTNEEKIANAMSAALTVIGKDATVLDWPAKDGDDLSQLRAGTNEWTCLPDLPATPGNDPICADKTAMIWFKAYMEHKTPTLAQAGLAYMLQGGSDASNTDPFATTPKPGESWMNVPAHIMIFPAQKLDAKVYGINPDSGKPWIMFADTPYEHIMMPVK